MRRFGPGSFNQSVERKALRLGVASAALVAAGGAAGQVLPGASYTTVTTSGSNTTVTTTNVLGPVALARLSQFDVAAGTVATMVVPGGASTLVSFVDRTATTLIDGTVVGRMGSSAGAVGGHLLFVTPGGLTLGGTGRMEAGRVSIFSPARSAALDAIFDGDDLRGDAVPNLFALDMEGGGDILLNGRIFAPGGITLRGATISIGKAGVIAAGKSAADEFEAIGHVNMGELLPASRIVDTDGNIELVAETTITLTAGDGTDPGGRLDARPFDYDGGTTTGGISATAPTISFGAGTVVDAWDEGTNRGGAITLLAEEKDFALGGITALGGFPDATASITLDGTIEGASVDVAAKATATTESEDFDLPTLVLNNIIDVFFDAIGFQVALARAEANATVSVGADAGIAARAGDLSLLAENNAGAIADPLKLPVFINTTGRKFGFGFVYAQLEVNAGVTVGADAALSASNNLTVQAINTAESAASASSLSRGENSVALAIGVTVSDVTSNVSFAGGSTVDAGNNVVLKARNHSSFDLAVSAKSIENGKAGGAVGVAYQTTDSTVDFAGSIGSIARPNNVSILAENDISKNVTDVDVSVATGLIDQLAALPTDAVFNKLPGALQNFLGKRQQATLPDDANPGTKASGVVSLQLGAHGASASLAPSASINAAFDTTIDSSVREGVRLDASPNSGDGVVRNNASARTAATREIDGVNRTFTAAIGVTLTDLTASSTVGEAASVTSGRLAVDSGVERIYTENWTTEAPGADLDEIKDFFLNLAGKAAVDLGLVDGFMTNSAGAIANTEGEANAISGSVAFSGVRGTSTAWVDSRADLELGGDRVEPTGIVPSLAVTAATRLEGLQLAGPISLLSLGASSDGGSAGGGSLGVSLWDPNAKAGIGDGVTIRSAGSVRVASDTDTRSIIIAPMAGSGGGIGFAGTLAVNIVEGDSKASISNAADIEADGSVIVTADNGLVMWSAAGTLALSSGSGQGETAGSIGIASAVNLAFMDSDARIGDNNEDDPSTPTAARADPAAGKVETPGKVEVSADTQGDGGTIAVAGSYAGSSDGQPGVLDKIKNTLKINEASAFISGVKTGMVQKLANTLEVTRLGARDIGGGSETTTSDGPTSGFAAAGSATVTYTDLSTKAFIEGATIRNPNAGASEGDVSVLALNDLDLYSINGGVAISKQSGKNVDSSRTLSGAFGVQFTTNDATAKVTDSLVEGKDSLVVGALTEGLRIAAGVSLSVDISKDGASSLAASGSISYSDVRDTALAEVADSRIISPDADPGEHVSVSALNQITIGTGAGGIAGGKNNSAGVAVTAGDAAGWQGVRAAEAAVRRSVVRGFDDMAVVARNEAKLIGVGLTVAVSASSNGNANAFVGTAVINNVDQDALAEIVVSDPGDGQPAIRIVDQLVVEAGDGEADAPFVIPLAAQKPTNIGGGFAATYDVSADDLDLDPDAPVTLGKPDFDAGARVFGVAGGVGVAKGGGNANAVGLAVAFNRVDNDQIARVTGTGAAPAIDVGRLAVRASDEAEILGIAAGLSASNGKFAGMGSATINIISGTAQASVETAEGSAGRLAVTVRDTAGADVSAAASGDIWSFGGAVAISTKGAGAGAGVAVNELVREGDDTPGVEAAVRNVDLTARGPVTVSTDTDGAIKTLAGAVGVGKAVAIAGAAAANNIQSVANAEMSGTNVSALGGERPTISVSSVNRSTIDSAAVTVAAAFGGGGVGVSLAVNRISPTMSALVSGGTIETRGLAVDSRSAASIRTLAMGVGGGSELGGAGSIAVNLVGTDVDARIRGGANVTASDSVLVVGRQTNSIEIVSGSVGIGINVGGLGAGFTVNDIYGTTDAAIGDSDDARTTVTASGNGGAATIFTGDLANPVPTGNDIEAFVNQDLRQTETTTRGIAVNASSGHSVISFGAAAGVGNYVGAGIIGNVNQIGGTTTAQVENANANANGAGANSGSGVDVRASTNAISATGLLGLGGSLGFSLSTTLGGDGFAFDTTAKLANATVTAASQGDVDVLAKGTQTAAQLIAGAAIGAGAIGIAAAVVDTKSTVSARVENGSTVTARGVTVNADNAIGVLSGGLGVAAGGLGAGGALVLLFNDATAEAIVGDDDGGAGPSATIDASTVEVAANSTTSFDLYGGAGAVGAGFSLAGVGMVAIQTGTTRALVQDAVISDGGTARSSSFSLTAAEDLDISSAAGALSLDFAGVGLGLGVTVISAQSDVLAEAVDSTIRANTVDIDATSDAEVDSLLLSAGIGGSAGISAAISLVQFGNGESGDFFTNEEVGGTGASNASVDNLLGQANVGEDALATAPLTSAERSRLSDTNSGSAGASAAIAAPEAHRVAARVRETATGTMLVDGGTVDIGADAAVRTIGRAPNVAAGFLAVAGTANIVRVYSNVEATAGPGSTISATNVAIRAGTDEQPGTAAGQTEPDGGSLDLEYPTTARRAAEGYSVLGAVGAVTGAVAYTDAKVAANVDAQALGTITGTGGGTLTIAAHDRTEAGAQTLAVSGSLIGLNGSIAVATKTSDVDARLTGSATGFGTVTLSADEGGRAEARAVSGSGGIFGTADAAVATASNTVNVNATIAEGARVQAANALSVSATSAPITSANAFGVAVSGGVAIGAAVANSTAAPTVQARVGEGADLSGAGALSVSARLVAPADAALAMVTARATAGTGGYLVGLNGSSSRAINAANVRAQVGTNLVGATTLAPVRLPTGTLTILADRQTRQSAEGLGVAVGMLALGGHFAEAKATGEARAELNEATAAGRTTADASIRALNDDDNEAQSIAGSGGIAAGAAAVTEVTAETNVYAVFKPADFSAGTFRLEAENRSRMAGGADAKNAAAVGASGGELTTTFGTETEALFASGAGLNAQLVDIVASTTPILEDGPDGFAAQGGSGGLLNGAGAAAYNNLTGTTRARVGENARITQRVAPGEDRFENGWGVRIDAGTELQGRQTVRLDAYGLIQVPLGKLETTATFNTVAGVAQGSVISADRSIGVGSRGGSAYNGVAITKVYGGASYGEAEVDIDITANQDTGILAGARLETLGEVRLSAGANAEAGDPNQFSVEANGEVFNYTAIPLNTEAGAEATVTASNQLALRDGAVIRAGRDVFLNAGVTGDAVKARGIGRNPYLELIGTSEETGTATFNATGQLFLDGASVEAGAFGQRSIAFTQASGGGVSVATTGINRTDPTALDYVPILTNTSINLRAGIDQRLVELQAALAAGDLTAAAEIETLTAIRDQVRAGDIASVLTGDLFAAAGNIAVDAETVTGLKATQFTARGRPTVTVTNDSDRSLILGRVFVPMSNGGNVSNRGSASLASVAGLTITEIDADEAGEVSVRNGRLGEAGQPVSDVIVGSGINNVGGSVDVKVANGSLVQLAPVEAGAYSADVPNGAFIANQPGSDWVKDVPIALWRNALGQVNPVTTSNETLANYVATAVLAEQSLPPALVNSYFLLEGTGNNTSVTWVRGSDGKIFNDENGSSFGAGTFPVAIQLDHGSPSNPDGTIFAGGLFALSPTIELGSAVAATPSSDAIRARTFLVNANWVNISGRIVVGTPSERSVRILPFADSYVAAQIAQNPGLTEIAIPATAIISGVNRTLTETLLPGDRPITVVFVPAQPGSGSTAGQYLVRNVEATGGGFASITGRIANTNHSTDPARSGQITVLNGLGDIRIENQTSRGLVLSDVNAGVSPVGTVIINDLQRSIRSEYRHVRGEGITLTTSSLGGGSPNVQAIAGDAAVYNPQAGIRYRWTDGVTLRRSVDFRDFDDSTVSVWSRDPYNAPSTGFFFVGAPGAPAFRQVHNGNYSTSGAIFTYNDGKSDEFTWTYRVPTVANLSISNTVRGDYPIGIRFEGSSTGQVNVSSAPGISLAGRITNPLGTTTLVSSAGAVTQGLGATIETQNLTLSAALGIGRADSPFGARLTGSTVDLTSGADINLDFSASAGDTFVRRLVAAGDVRLVSAGSILRASGANAVQIEGRNIDLSAPFGSIGTVAEPIIIRAVASIDANGGAANGVLTAEARDGLAITQSTGDLRVGRVEATAGDVLLRAPGGAIVAATPNGAVDPAEAARLAQVWDALDIREGGGGDPAALAVNAVEGQFQRDYAAYRALVAGSSVSGSGRTVVDDALARQLGIEARLSLAADVGLLADIRANASVAADGSVSLTSQQAEGFRNLAQGRLGRRANGAAPLSVAEIAAVVEDQYRTISNRVASVLGSVPDDPAAIIVGPAEIDAFASRRFAELTSGFVDLFGNNLPFDGTADYVLDLQPGDGLYERFTTGVTWRDSWLDVVISRNALTPVAKTQFLRTTPEIIGRAITLEARDGIGSSDAPVTFLIAPGTVLTDEQKAALVAAGPGDVLEEDLGPNQRRLTVSRDRLVQVSASATVSATAGGALFLGAAGDLGLTRLTAGGDIRVVASEDLFQADSGPTSEVKGRNLRVEASGGSIGSAAAPLRVDVSQVEVARAADDIFITARRDLNLGNLFAGDVARLMAPDGAILSIFPDDGVLHIQAERLEFEARAGIGTSLQPLQIATGSGGVFARNSSAATIALAAPTTEVLVTGLQSRDIQLTGAGGYAIAGPVDSTRLIRIDTGGPVSLGAAGRLSGEDILVSAASLTMADGSSMAAIDMLTLAAAGELSARNLTAASALVSAGGDAAVLNAATAGSFGIDVLGALTGTNLDIGADMLATAGGDLVLAGLTAGGATTLDAGEALAGTDVTVSGGLTATAGGDMTLNQLSAGTTVLGSGADLTGADWTIAGDLLGTAGGRMELSRVDVTGSAGLDAGDNLVLADVSVGGAAGLDAGGAMQLADVSVGGALDAAAVGIMMLERVQAASAGLMAGGDLTATNMAVGGPMTADAGRDMALRDISAGVTDVMAGRDIDLAGRVATGPFSAQAGGVIRVAAGAEVTAASPLALVAGGDLLLGAGSRTAATEAVTLDAARILADATSLVDAGTDLGIVADGLAELGRLSAGDGMAIDAGSLLMAGDSRAGGSVSLEVAGTARIADGVAVIAGDAMLIEAGGPLMIGTGTLLESGGTMGIAAASMAAAPSSRMVVGDALDVETAGDMALGLVEVDGAADFRSGGRMLLASNISSGGAMTIAAGGDMRLGAGSRLEAERLQATAGGAIATEGAQLATRGDLGLDADGDLLLGRMSAGGDLGLSGRSLTLSGDVDAVSLEAAIEQDARLAAGMRLAGDGSIAARSFAMSPGAGIDARSLEIDARAGDILLGRVRLSASSGVAARLLASGSITGNGDPGAQLTVGTGARTILTAGGSIGAADRAFVLDVPDLSIASRTGSIWLKALSDLDMGVSVPNGRLFVEALGALALSGETGDATLDVGGPLRIGTLRASRASLASRGGLAADGLSLGGPLAIASPDIRVGTLTATGAGAMQLTIGGFAPGSAAQDVVFGQIVAPGGLVFPSLRAARSAFVTTTASVRVESGFAAERFAIDTLSAKVLFSRSAVVEPRFDAQLYDLDPAFRLILEGRTLLSDTPVSTSRLRMRLLDADGFGVSTVADLVERQDLAPPSARRLADEENPPAPVVVDEVPGGAVRVDVTAAVMPQAPALLAFKDR